MSACPTSEAGQRIPCIDRVADSYTAPPEERMDVIRPDTEHPTTLSALGSKLSASGFANPYPAKGGVQPRPATTPTGIDWCNPEPKQQEPGQLKEGENPTSAKPCPNPALEALGGQGAGTRERSPVNGSYGRQLSVAWEEPVENTGSPATLSTTIPAADGNVSGYKALYMAASVNFFDSRNPARGEEGQWNPETAPQNFTIAVTDAAGHEASVEAGDPRYGTALQQTLGSISARVHVILRDIRVPLADLAAQGIDLSRVRKVELRFGELGMPQSGSIQLADVRFQQPVGGSKVLLDSTAANAGPGEGPPASGPNPVAEMEQGVYTRADGSFEIPDVTEKPGASVWTVDDDGAQCPNAQFEHIQEAVEYASPWDTIVVCPGTYAESSTPVNSELSPVQTGAMNGLTINKPLKIIGAGAGKVTIKPAASLGSTLAGTEPFLRDGGGNVVTVSRQSMGSTEYDEEYVDISGVTIESPSAYVEAGVNFFNSSGRISDSVIGPLKRVAKAEELTAKPYGYGVLASNSLIGAGSGTAERQVTIIGSKIAGYQAGGVRIDDGRGTDASATANEPSGIKELGYIQNTTIEGQKSTVFPQVGVQFHAGASGKVTGSAITNNSYATAPVKSAGVLLTQAGPVSIGGSLFSGDGYGVYNANATNTEVRKGAPVSADGDFWGAGGNPVEGPTIAGPPEQEGISPLDGEANASVLVPSVLGSAPAVPAVPPALPDAAPAGEIVNPGDGEAAEAGAAVEPVVLAEDDYGVKSVTLKANGSSVGTRAQSPYAFTWTPTAAEIGTSVQLEATITDSSGQVTTNSITVPVEASIGETEAKEKQEQAAKEAKEAAEKAAAAEREVKEAIERAEAAAKAAQENATAATKAAEEKAAAAVRAAEEKAAAAVKAAEEKAPVSTGRVSKDKAKGTARLGVVVPTPGKLVASGPGIQTVSGNPTAPGEVQILIKAKGKALKTLDKKGTVSVTVKVAFTGPSGSSQATTTVVLVKK
jgi:hypothetical protein